MIVLKSDSEIAVMRECGKINVEVLSSIREAVRPGISTMALNKIADDILKKNKATGIFKGYSFDGRLPPYPTVTNICLNEELVHGIPKHDRFLQEGDVISVDCGTYYKGYIADSAFSMAVGQVNGKVKHLLEVTEESLYVGIKQAMDGNRVGDISHAIQSFVEGHGFNVVRGYGGHGVGRTMHEDPHIPNYGRQRRGTKLRAGMTIAIEPMVLQGDKEVITRDDQWTVASKDGKLTAHFEHTILIRDGEAEILTKWE